MAAAGRAMRSSSLTSTSRYVHRHWIKKSHKPIQTYNQEFLSAVRSNCYVLFKFCADPQCPRYNLRPHPADPVLLLLQVDPQEGQER